MIPFPQVRMVHPALNYLLDPVQVGVLARQGPRFSSRMVKRKKGQDQGTSVQKTVWAVMRCIHSGLSL